MGDRFVPLKRWLAGVGLLLALGAGALTAWLTRPALPPHASLAAPGEVAPALSFEVLDGAPVSLASLRGKVVLVNFWASWCAPCIEELPLLVKAQADYGARGLQVIGPAMDEAALVKPIIERFGINYPVSVGFEQADAAMRAFGDDQGALPFSILVGRDGQILRRYLGGLHPEELQAMLAEQFG